LEQGPLLPSGVRASVPLIAAEIDSAAAQIVGYRRLTMERILSRELSAAAGRRVTLAGWVHRRRQLGAVSFLVLRDRTGLAQVVVREDARAGLAELGEETIVQVTGQAVASPAAPGGVEVVNPEIAVLSSVAEQPPFDLYRPVVSASLPTILDNAAVSLRHPRLAAPHLIAAASVAGFRAALEARGFVAVHTPKIVASATESGANVFPIDYFGQHAYLAQSPQLYKQMLVGVFERVYEVGPVFRAEPHDTARHLAQYTSLDAELGFIRDHVDVIAVLRHALAGMVDEIGRRCPQQLELLDVALPTVPETIPSVHFAEALEMVGAERDEDLSAEPDLAPAHERWLSDWALKEYGSELVAVTGYPMVKRPFYTHPDPDRPEYSNSFDLLFRGLELVTGGQRLHRYEDYLAALTASGQPTQPFEGYLAAFKHGMPPHGGFAIGLERWVARLVGAANIREVTLFPRDLHRLTP
jgi:nondiscriminating aspartyl-tRNA synthetase